MKSRRPRRLNNAAAADAMNTAAVPETRAPKTTAPEAVAPEMAQPTAESPASRSHSAPQTASTAAPSVSPAAQKEEERPDDTNLSKKQQPKMPFLFGGEEAVLKKTPKLAFLYDTEISADSKGQEETVTNVDVKATIDKEKEMNGPIESKTSTETPAAVEQRSVATKMVMQRSQGRAITKGIKERTRNIHSDTSATTTGMNTINEDSQLREMKASKVTEDLKQSIGQPVKPLTENLSEKKAADATVLPHRVSCISKPPKLKRHHLINAKTQTQSSEAQKTSLKPKENILIKEELGNVLQPQPEIDPKESSDATTTVSKSTHTFTNKNTTTSVRMAKMFKKKTKKHGSNIKTTDIKTEEEASRKDIEEEKATQLKSEQAALKAEEEAIVRLKAEEEAAQIEAKRREAAARLKAEEEAARFKAEREAIRLKAEEEAARFKTEREAIRLKAEKEAARFKAEQEAIRLKAEKEAARIMAEQEAIRLKAEEEAAQIVAKAREEAARFKAEQEAIRLKAEEEAAQIEAERREAAARLRAEEEAARFKSEQEAIRLKAEEGAAQIVAKAREEAARLKAEQEAVRLKVEEEATRLKLAQEPVHANTEEETAEEMAQKEAVRRKELRQARKKAREEAARIQAEEAAARRKARREARKQAEKLRIAEAEEAARKKAEAEEIARKKAEGEEIARKKAEGEEIARKKAEAEEAARKKAEAEEAARKKAEAEEAAREKAEAEEAARKRTESPKERRHLAKKKIERYRKQAELREHRRVQEAALAAAAAAATEGAIDTPLIDTKTKESKPSALPSADALLEDALTFPNERVSVQRFDDEELVAQRRSLDDSWEIGLRFDWSVKTLAIGSLPLFVSTDPRRKHPFMKKYESRPVWFLEEVNGVKANNIRDVMEALKKSLKARFVFRK